MERRATLFRQQAVNHASNKLYGDVVAIPYIPHTVFFVLTLFCLSYLSYISLSLAWEVTESVHGKIISQQEKSLVIRINDENVIPFLDKKYQIRLEYSLPNNTKRSMNAIIDHFSEDGSYVYAEMEHMQSLPKDITVTLVVGHQNIIEWFLDRENNH